MNNDVFQLVDAGVKFSFDQEETLSSIPQRYFQEFTTIPNLFLLRHVSVHYPKEAQEVCDYLETLKIKLAELPEKSRMIERILDATMSPQSVRILMIKAFHSVSLHRDINDDGLKNLFQQK